MPSGHPPSFNPALPARTPARRVRGRLRFSASIGAVVALHAAAIAVVAAAPGPSPAGFAPGWAPSITVVSVAPATARETRLALASSPPLSAATVDVASADTRADSRPVTPRVETGPARVAPPRSAAPPTARRPLAASPEVLPAFTTVASADTPDHFYSTSEVERPAQPSSDWNLDTALLDLNGIGSLVFDIFIGRDGEVVACTILDPVELAPETRQLLEERLRQTVTEPAVREGRPVASVRRIEVSVSAGSG